MCDPAILVDHGLTEIGLIIWEYIYMLQQAVTWFKFSEFCHPEFDFDVSWYKGTFDGETDIQ